MINLGKDLLAKIRREIGPPRPGVDRLTLEAKVWRAVSAHAPGLSAEESLALTAQIVRAYEQAGGRAPSREAA